MIDYIDGGLQRRGMKSNETKRNEMKWNEIKLDGTTSNQGNEMKTKPNQIKSYHMMTLFDTAPAPLLLCVVFVL